jgi:hypothetical protein
MLKSNVISFEGLHVRVGAYIANDEIGVAWVLKEKFLGFYGPCPVSMHAGHSLRPEIPV